MTANNAINNTLQSPFNVGATSVTSTGTQLNYLNGLTAVPINKINVQVFTASGSNTYTPTSGTKYAFVELWGAGGGGGASSSATVPGASGGGGAYAAAIVTAPSTVTISIGTGGNGQAANNGTAGTSGGNTTYNTTTIVAAGGAAGNNNTGGAGGATGSCTGTKLIAGGNGANAPGITSLFISGGASPGLTNNFIYSGTTANGAANTGQGGGSGYSGGAGGNGGSGYAVVTEFISADRKSVV